MNPEEIIISIKERGLIPGGTEVSCKSIDAGKQVLCFYQMYLEGLTDKDLSSQLHNLVFGEKGLLGLTLERTDLLDSHSPTPSLHSELENRLCNNVVLILKPSAVAHSGRRMQEQRITDTVSSTDILAVLCLAEMRDMVSQHFSSIPLIVVPKSMGMISLGGAMRMMCLSHPIPAYLSQYPDYFNAFVMLVKQYNIFKFRMHLVRFHVPTDVALKKWPSLIPSFGAAEPDDMEVRGYIRFPMTDDISKHLGEKITEVLQDTVGNYLLPESSTILKRTVSGGMREQLEMHCTSPLHLLSSDCLFYIQTAMPAVSLTMRILKGSLRQVLWYPQALKFIMEKTCSSLFQRQAFKDMGLSMVSDQSDAAKSSAYIVRLVASEKRVLELERALRESEEKLGVLEQGTAHRA